MAVYNPPKKNLPIFDNLLFIQNTDTVTVDYGNNNYLRYPNAQGTENLQDINVAGDAVFYSTTQFDGTVNVGSGTTGNNLPVVNTNKSLLNLGSGGNGTINVACPMTVGGFGSLGLVSSTLSLTSGARITQGSTTNINTLSGTNVTTAYGATSTTSIKISDSVATQSVNVIPNATAGAYNPLTAINDVVVYGDGSAINTKGLTLTSHSSTNSGVKILPSSVTIGAGGTTTSPVTSATYDGTNITFTSPNPPLSTATQPAPTDSSNKIPTTAWVQSAITSGSTTIPMPYLWFMSNNITGVDLGSFNLNCSGTSTNQYFTVRFFFDTQYTFTSGTAYQYQNQYSGTMDIYPFRVPTITGASGICQLSGSINSNTNFSMTDATYAPTGRWYYVYSAINNQTPSTSPAPLPYPNIYLTSTANSAVIFNLKMPSANTTCIYKISGSLEVINKGPSAITFSSSGISTNPNIATYYSTF